MDSSQRVSISFEFCDVSLLRVEYRSFFVNDVCVVCVSCVWVWRGIDAIGCVRHFIRICSENQISRPIKTDQDVSVPGKGSPV